MDKDFSFLEKFCGYDYLEAEVSDRIIREKVHVVLYENRIDLKEMLKAKIIFPNESAKFNHILGLIKFHYHINLYEILVCFMEDGHEPKKLVALLDPDNRSKIESELKDIYRIRVSEDEVGLDDFLI